MSEDAFHDHERMDVYRVALELHVLATKLLNARCSRVVRDQLERASLSVVLNVAEGAGRRARADKHRFYAIARGSTTECAAIFDALFARSALAPSEHENARRLTLRLAQMLSRLLV
ncbi:MAG: four helix bundle protein [Polyangiaceae bacterium]|nr:four helix bundle protein [Polyangiaceae bacterium]